MKWQRIGIHWVGGRGNLSWITTNQIRAWHMQRGWRDIGYHRVIVHPALYAHKYEEDDIHPGTLIKLGRALNNNLEVESMEIPAAIKGHNTGTLMICVVAGPDMPPHQLQLEALKENVDIFRERYDIPRENVFGHNEFLGHKANRCPGPDIGMWLMGYRGGINA